MKSRWERWRTSAPPKKLTVREVVATVVAFAAAVGVFGPVFGRWLDMIGAGTSAAGGHLVHQWWNGLTAQPEYENEGGGA